MSHETWDNKSAAQTITVWSRRLTHTAVAMGLTVALLGGGHLVAWITGHLAQLALSTIVMTTNLALCLTLSGIALLLQLLGRDVLTRQWAARTCAAVVFVIAALTLGENLFGWNFGIDLLIAKEPSGAVGVASPNRMGTPAAAGVVLASLSLLILSRTDRRGVRAAQWMAVGVSLIGSLGTVGFLYGAQGLYTIVRVTAIAWPSALGLLALGLGILFARPSNGLMAIFTADDSSGQVVRWMLLPAVGLPLAVGYVRLFGERHGVFDAAMGTALVMLLFMVTFTFLAYQSGLRLSRREASERASQEDLREQAALLKAAEAIQEERQRLYRVLETLPPMVCLLTPDYHVAFANRSFRKRFGESEGRHCYEYCFGCSQPCEFCESYNVLKTGKPHHWEVKGLDGSIIDAHDFPFTDVDGSPLILEMDIDITEQRRTEAALREVGAYNRTLIEASPDPLVTIGPDGRIADVNAATEHATGHNRQELVGTDFSEYFTEPDKAKAGYQQVFREGTVRNYPLEIRHRDGHTAPVLYNATVYRDAADKVIGVFAAARDISDLMQAERELRQAHEDLAARASQLRALAGELTLSEQRERTRLAKVLHDHLQQLLVAMKFRVAILGRGGDDLLKQGTKEVEDLIDESIAASRSLTAELSPPILHEAGLNAGLRWLARRMKETHGLFVDLELEESEPLSEAYNILLFESVRELLFNVVKHANVLSALVSLRRSDDSLRVVVSDQGKGFDPTSLPAAGEAGRGFGLFVIRERLELMGGSFKIESSPGQGSQFVLSMPVGPSPKIEQIPQPVITLPEAPLLSPLYPDPGRKIRVMLADDHAVVRQGIANLLRDEPDMDVVGAAVNGQEAVELVPKLQPDVILMDVGMLVLDGIEATHIIHKQFPEICIIGLSMFEDVERAQAMRDAGAANYLTKSGPVENLIKAIRTSASNSEIKSSSARMM